MTALVTRRAHRLASSLAELKTKVRTALTTELAGAIGLAVRDVLIVALLDRLTTTPTRPAARTTMPRSGGWRDEDDERDRWGQPDDPWADLDDDHHARGDRSRDRYEHPEPDHAERDKAEPLPAVPTAAALAVGVNVGRWWLARKGAVSTAIGFGVLTTVLGLTSGPFARAALAVLAAATDLLTAESALARLDPA